LLILTVMATRQMGHIAEALQSRELDALRQCARSVSRELSYLVPQEEGRLLAHLDLDSVEALVDSLVWIDAAFTGMTCFALMEDGTFLYPREAASAPSAVRNESFEKIAASKLQLLGRLEGREQARVYLGDGPRPLITSLRRLSLGEERGMVGISWSTATVAGWCRTVASDVVPAGYVCELADSAGRVLLRHPHAPHLNGEVDDGSRWSPGSRLPEGSFPWVVRAMPSDPGAVRRLTRRHVVFYAGVVVFLSLLIVAGVWLVVAVAFREAELGRMKADFAANVSHELRTPLAMIRAAGEALSMRTDLDAGQKERYLGIIGKESRRLTDLIGNVLSFSGIERGSRTYDLRRTDICGLVRDFVSDYRTRAEAEGFMLETRIPDRELWVSLDADAVQLVLVNLMDNAIKFSGEKRSIRVSVDMHEDNVGFSVRDEGIGIPSEDLERIFGSFYRVEQDLVKETRGTGIGLALVREIVQAHGGRVDVRSTPGRGSTFTVLLPSDA
jgi:signal transduction histidine kinase